MFNWFNEKKVFLVEAVILVLNKKKAMALFHTPVLGGFLTLFFGLFIALKHSKIRFEIKEGIAAQIIIPFIFSVIALIKYVSWFFGFDLINFLLSFVLIIYLLVGYGIMLLAAIKILSGKNYSYYFFNSFVKNFPKAFFGSEK